MSIVSLVVVVSVTVGLIVQQRWSQGQLQNKVNQVVDDVNKSTKYDYESEKRRAQELAKVETDVNDLNSQTTRDIAKLSSVQVKHGDDIYKLDTQYHDMNDSYASQFSSLNAQNTVFGESLNSTNDAVANVTSDVVDVRGQLMSTNNAMNLMDVSNQSTFSNYNTRLNSVQAEQSQFYKINDPGLTAQFSTLTGNLSLTNSQVARIGDSLSTTSSALSNQGQSIANLTSGFANVQNGLGFVTSNYATTSSVSGVQANLAGLSNSLPNTYASITGINNLNNVTAGLGASINSIQSNITNVNSALNSSGSNVVSLSSTMSALSNTVNTLQTNLSTLTGNVNTIQSSYATQASVSNLNSTLNAAQSTVSQVQGLVNTINSAYATKTDIANLQNQLTSEQSSINQLSTMLAGDTNAVASAQSNLAQIQTTLSSIPTQSNLTNLQTGLSNLTALVGTNQSSTNTNLQGITANVGSNTANVASLKTQLGTLSSTVGTAQSNTITNANTITTLQNSMNNLQTNLTNATNLVNSVQTNLANNYATSAQLNAMNASLSNAIYSVKSSTSVASSNFTYLTTNKLQLGNKWLFSGVGDNQANDSWLRMFDAQGSNYSGGIAMANLWTRDNAYLNGTTQVANLTTGPLTGTSATFNGQLQNNGTTILNGMTNLNNNTISLRGDNNHGLVYSGDVDGPNLYGFSGGKLSSQGKTALQWNSNGNTALNNNSMLLRSPADTCHGLEYGLGTAGNYNTDGPVLWGNGGGGLGYGCQGGPLALQWTSQPAVTLNQHLKMQNNWDNGAFTDPGGAQYNPANASIANDVGNYKELMLVGNRSGGAERRIGMWDTVNMNGQVNMNGGPLNMNNQTISLRGDPNHGLVYSGDVDGPNLYGYSGGKLSANGNTAIQWDNNKNVSVPGNMNVAGNFTVGGKPVSSGGGGTTFNGSNATGIQITNGDPGALIEKNYGYPNNRYGVGQFPGGNTRTYTAGPGANGYTSGSVNMSIAKSDNTFIDAVKVTQDANGNPTTTITGPTNINGPVTANTAQTGSYAVPASQGGYLMWNRTNGNGATAIVNQQGGGPGGFEFVNYSDTKGTNKIVGSADANGNWNLPNVTTGGLNVNGTTAINQGSLQVNSTGISTAAGTDWMRIYGTGNGTAMYGGVSINQGGGLNVGNWGNIPQGQIQTSSDVHVGGTLYVDRICNNSGGGGQRCISLWDSTGGQGAATIKNWNNSKLSIQDDANTVLYNSKGNAIWSTGTNGKN